MLNNQRNHNLVRFREDIRSFFTTGIWLSQKDLTLKLSSGLELSQDDTFCDFEFFGIGSEGYSLYKLGQEFLDGEINKLCNDEFLSDLKISLERCLSDFKEEILFRCDLLTKDDYSQEGDIVQNIIIAEADYTFEIGSSIGLEVMEF